MLEKETADIITFILIGIVGLEFVVIISLGVWRRLYLQQFTPNSARASSRSSVSTSRQGATGNLRDTSAAPLHHQSSDTARNRRDKK